MADFPFIAYAPVKRIIKQEMPEEQEGNSIGEENLTLQLLEDSVVMADLVPIIAYPPIQKKIKVEIQDEPQEENNNVEEENLVFAQRLIAYHPIQRTIKQEILDGHPEVNNNEEENWKLQVPKDSDSSTGNARIDLPIGNASLPSEDSGESNERLRASSSQSGQYHQTTMNDLEERETQEDAQMAEELDSDEEGSDFEKEMERSEHSSQEDLETSADSTDVEEDFIPVVKAGPSKEPTRQAQKASHLNKGEGGSNTTALFKCSKCERSYRSKYSLTSHMKNECGIEPRFPCTQCDGHFKRKNDLQRHLINVHKIDPKKLDEHGAGFKDRQGLAFKCTKCDSAYKQKRALDHHTKNECGVVFTCSLCKQNLTAKSSLRNHLLNVHNIAHRKLYKYGVGNKDRSLQPFKCDRCGRTYKHKKSLTSHLAVGCGVEPSLSCPKCDCRCKRKASLKLHLIEIHQVDQSQLAAFGLGPVVNPENQFKCDRCGKSYKSKNSLKRHLTEKCGK